MGDDIDTAAKEASKSSLTSCLIKILCRALSFVIQEGLLCAKYMHLSYCNVNTLTNSSHLLTTRARKRAGLSMYNYVYKKNCN